MDQVWYAGYGSNLAWERFRCYLRGGRPEGAARELSGARDHADPDAVEPVELAGTVYFAWESPTWGGGIAFYDASAGGTSLGRAYLVTTGQFADIAAQEMHREPGRDLAVDAFAGLVGAGQLVLGRGRYETLHVVGEIAGIPVVTFTSSGEDDPLPLHPPRAAYLQMMARGLADAHGLDDAAVVDYLLDRPGCRPTWTRETLTRVVKGPVAEGA
ncbi:MAG: histone deacetylase [Nocardioidaceae bacterium]